MKHPVVPVLALVVSASALAPLPAEAAAKKPARAFDFDGDGKTDAVLASGASLSIFYGPARKRQRLPFRAALTTSWDFDRDGYADLAAAKEDSGEIVIRYGSRAGIGERRRVLRVERPVVELDGGAEKVEAAIASLAGGDFDGDGKADLAYATPLAAAFFVVPGLTGSGRRYDVTGSFDVGADLLRLSAADVTGDGRTDLFAEVQGFMPGIGVGLYRGGAAGLTRTAVSGLTEGFTVGDFDGDGIGDVAAPSEGRAGRGEIRTWHGGRSGLTAWRRITQDTPGVPGKGEKNDGFGSTLAAADVDRDGRADLIAGTPREDVGKIKDAGSVTVLYGSRKGLTGKRSHQFTQDTRGVPGRARRGDLFGSDVTPAGGAFLVEAAGERRTYVLRRLTF
ncbi:FG-GAP and VCBS repeat-containing protein [Actinocorallia longicatena]|uniref:FG-GAP-like repeat-containing protein n=1 Tax=Actinocorallia longicatena TaxID=111803 RepID=A0ABP6QSI3_9ACTN